MKRAALAMVLAAATAGLLAGCGGGSGGSSQTSKSNLTNRAFVSNAFGGTLQIVDAQLDKNTQFAISVGSSPTTVLLSKDKTVILTYSATTGALTAVDPVTESATGSVTLPTFIDSLAMTEDGKFLYAAEKNAPVTGQPAGQIQALSLKDTSINRGPFPIPAARWLALNHSGNVILAFSDQSNTVTKFDPTATTPTPTIVAGPFDRPIAAYFSADDSKAYILNCGPECGGTTASVTELTIANGTTRNVAVSAATVGALDGNNLYVAGAPNGSGGTFQVIDTGAMTASTPKNISNGTHTQMLVSGGKVWVGASNCGANQGCLSIYNTSDQSVSVDNPANGGASKGNVTGMAPVSGRNVVYITEGGELRVYDTNTGGEITPIALDIVGQASGVVTIP